MPYLINDYSLKLLRNSNVYFNYLMLEIRNGRNETNIKSFVLFLNRIITMYFPKQINNLDNKYNHLSFHLLK